MLMTDTLIVCKYDMAKQVISLVLQEFTERLQMLILIHDKQNKSVREFFICIVWRKAIWWVCK